MLAQVVVVVSGSVLLAFFASAIELAYRTYRKREVFRRKSKGIPFIDHYCIFGGHVANFFMNRRVWQLIGLYKDKLGETFAFMYGPKAAVVTHDLDMIKRMVVDNDECLRIERFGLPIDELEVDCIFTAGGEQWSRLRRATAPAFSRMKFKNPNVQAEIEDILEKFISSVDSRLRLKKERSGEASSEEDAEDIFHRFALAIVFTCFYKERNIIDFNTKQDFYQRAANIGLRTVTGIPMKLSVVFPILRPFVRFLAEFHTQGSTKRVLMSLIRRQTSMNLRARSHLRSDTAPMDTMILNDGSEFRRNMIDHIIDQYHEGRLTTREYFHTSFFLFLAANKTTADAIVKLVYLLAVNQDKQRKLRESILKSGCESEYLLWCINEAMRLFPPALGGCSREVSRELTTRDGYLIPAGTLVVTPTYTIHRLTEYWGQDVEEFRPERWADSSHFHPMQFLPFGAGKRICPGRDFAIHNIKILMDAMMRRYKFEYVSGSNDDMLFEAPFLIFTVSDGPTNIKITALD